MSRFRIVCFFFFVSVLIAGLHVFELLEWLKEPELNQGHLMGHWSTYLLRLLLIVSPVAFFMVLKRSVAAAYVVMLTILCAASYWMFWAYLAPSPELGSYSLSFTVAAMIIFLFMVGFAVYAIRSSAKKDDDRSLLTKWWVIFLFVAFVITAFLAACQLTLADWRIALGRRWKGLVEYDKGNFKRAIELYDSALTKDPNNYITYYRRANARMALNDFNGAILDFDKAIRLDSATDTLVGLLCFNRRAFAKHSLGDLDGALSDYKVVVLSTKQHGRVFSPEENVMWKEEKARAHLNRGAIRLERSDVSDAKNDFERALFLTNDQEIIDSARHFLKRLAALGGGEGRALRVTYEK